MKRFILPLFFCVLFPLFIWAGTITVPIQIEWIKKVNTLQPGQTQWVYNTLNCNPLPGDTFLLAGGTRNPIRFDDLIGDSLNPLVICNANAQVTITKPVGGYYGLTFLRCRYIKVSGRNAPGLSYGIRICNLPAGNGVSIGDFTSNIEVEGLEIDHIFSSGIVAKTDPTCANLNAYQQFVMYGINIHHNYIHHVGNEGMYIGNTFFNDGAGWKLNCSNPSTSTTVFPHKIIGVWVHHNVLDSTGWDALQLASCYNALVFYNYIIRDSYKDQSSQMAGILIGQPSQASVYNNTLVESMGSAIQSFGVGTKIYNNQILYPGKSKWARGSYNSSGQLTGTQFTYGIYLNDKVCKDASVPQTPYQVFHNTIVIHQVYKMASPYNTWAPQGINANGLAYINGSEFTNNLVVIDTSFGSAAVTPICSVYATNAVPNYNILNNSAFISLNSRSTFGLNFFSNEVNSVGFENVNSSNFQLTTGSPAVNSALGSLVQNHTFLQTDLNSVARPQSLGPDFGAQEHSPLLLQSGLMKIITFPNPISKNSLSFQIFIPQDSLGTLEITLTDGTQAPYQLQPFQINEQNGNTYLNFSVAALPVQAGLYWVKVKQQQTLLGTTLIWLIP